MRLVLALALALSACAHSRVCPCATRSEPAPAPPPAPAPDSTHAEHVHGASGAHAPIALPGGPIDAATNAPLDDATFASRLLAARVIYVGEQHASPHDHAVELEVLSRAYAADPRIALGLEMLPRALQAPLDEFLDGKLDESQFLDAVDWPKTWGFDYGLYRPLFEFCRAHKLRVYALNAPRKLVHEVAFNGLDSLSADERRALPELSPGPPAHREYAREAFAQHPHSRFDDVEFERFYTAQLIWDETMAERIAQLLAAPAAPHRLIVVAGEGHVRRFAIPERAARRGAKPFVTILPVMDDDADDARADQAADVLWVMRAK